MTRPAHLRFRCPDGAWLTGDWFEPVGRACGGVLIAPAMGVRRGLYALFAEYLAEAGLATLVFDYRGIAEGRPAVLPGCSITLAQWAEQDLPAAARALGARAPGLPLALVGHSLGGQLLGLLRKPPFEAALMIASQSGYWKNWDGIRRAVMGALWYLAIPGLTPLFGYLPMRLAGQGEDLPAGVAQQWAEWGRDPRYVLKYLEERDGRTAFAFDKPMRFYAFSDDPYAPARAVQALMQAFPLAPRELRSITPSLADVHAIGHFGCFQPWVRDGLWHEQRAWLLQALQPVA
jgi:predicted alpha/beta hydrolase